MCKTYVFLDFSTRKKDRHGYSFILIEIERVSERESEVKEER